MLIKCREKVIDTFAKLLRKDLDNTFCVIILYLCIDFVLKVYVKIR